VRHRGREGGGDTANAEGVRYHVGLAAHIAIDKTRQRTVGAHQEGAHPPHPVMASKNY
jgi:hypothetical protein